MKVLRGLVADVIPFSWVDGPGNRTTIFLQGCNFDCKACHNPQTIAAQSVHARSMTIIDLVDEVRANAPFISGITVSGGEATFQPEFLAEFFTYLQADPELRDLTRFVDSNGATTPEVWSTLVPVLDGAMLDLKTFDPQLHLELTGKPVTQVLDSIELLASVGLLYEVRLLIVGGVNDDPDLLRRTGAWLSRVDPELQVVLNPFRRHGVRHPADGWAEATPEDLAKYAELLRTGGLSKIRIVPPLQIS
ncbi:MAG: radical SAM protein [Actinomycetes bacterium]